MQAFAQRITFSNRAFQNICTPYNIRTFPATPVRSSILNRFGTSGLQQQQARSVSTASLGFRGSQLRSRVWSPKRFGIGGALAGLGLGFAAFQYQRPVVLCEASYTSPANAPPRSDPTPTPLQLDDDALPPPPPRSSINVYELGFGTVAGICAGVFIKKGAKALAFILGGVFVLLQYLVSVRIVSVNWTSAESSYQDTFYSHSADTTGKTVRRPPTVYSLLRWLVNFLTADFPPRATFIAGLALGLRLG